jgi:hypothetical protein
VVGIKWKIDYPKSFTVTRFSKKLIVPIYLPKYMKEGDKYSVPKVSQKGKHISVVTTQTKIILC